MAYDRVKRNVYYDPPDEFPHTSRNHAEDFTDYILPQGRMHNAATHDRGIAAGLEVSGIPGATDVVISAGVAIDGAGQMIILAETGHGNVGNNPPAGDNNEVPVPVHLPLGSQSGKTAYVTIQSSLMLRPGEGSGGRLEQVPWLRLQPVSGAGAYVDNGTSVILAIVVISASGTLTALKSEDAGIAFRRRTLGQTLEELRIRRSLKPGNQLQETVAGKVNSGPAGGLQLSVPNPGDSILLSKEGGTHCASVEMRANTVICKDSAGREVVHIEANDAWLRVGAKGNEGDLIVHDKNGNPAMIFNGKKAELHLGTTQNDGNVIVRNSASNPGVRLDGEASRVSANNLNPIAGAAIDVNATFLRIHGTDLMLDGRSGGNKRALVDARNKLIINFANDYANGVDIQKLHLADHIKVGYWQAVDQWRPAYNQWVTFLEWPTGLPSSEWDYATTCEIGMADLGTVRNFWWGTDQTSFDDGNGNLVIRWAINIHDTGDDWLPWTRSVTWIAFRR